MGDMNNDRLQDLHSVDEIVKAISPAFGDLGSKVRDDRRLGEFPLGEKTESHAQKLSSFNALYQLCIILSVYLPPVIE